MELLTNRINGFHILFAPQLLGAIQVHMKVTHIVVVESAVSSEKFPQFDMAYHEGKGYNPVSELMRAIILRAVEDLNSPGELRDDALAFFYEESDEDDDDYIFSFISICRYLGFDPQATRDSIIHAEHRISTRRRAA